MPTRITQKAAAALASSPIFSRGRGLFAENTRNYFLPLSKLNKLLTGSWLILDDYSKGIFPPQFLDQQKAYQAEKDFRHSLTGVSAKDVGAGERRKPFWFGPRSCGYLKDFSQVCTHLARAGVKPPAKILELGCGTGWMAEFLAAMGFEVCGTTISEDDVKDANLRIRGLEAKGISASLSFLAAPMESVHTVVPNNSFDVVLVYEALHHAFDWRATLHSAFACLKPGGWFLIHEPNVLHTFVSYRVAKLTNTHEIGFRKGELVAELRKAGFRSIRSVGPRLHWFYLPHCLLAQK
ncbi:MAG: class I SAM-dependent methyltransferase [Limisphaerales bacterium]